MKLQEPLVLRQSNFERLLVAIAILFTLNIFIIINFDVGVILYAGLVLSIIVLIVVARLPTVKITVEDSGISFSEKTGKNAFGWQEVTGLYFSKTNSSIDLSNGIIFSVECGSFKSPEYVYRFFRQNRFKKVSGKDYRDILVGYAVNAKIEGDW